MNKNLNEIFSRMNVGQDATEQLLTILELPDSQFDTVYPQLKKNLEKSFDTNMVRKEILQQMEVTPISNFESEVEELNKVIATINEDKELSNNKKDLLVFLLNQSKDVVAELIDNPREKVKVKIVRTHEDAVLPAYAHNTDAGADIYAIEETKIPPHTTMVIKTGLKVAIPSGYEIQLRPRSGMSLKTTIRIPNAPATIDSEYRGEIGVIMENTGNLSYTINKGDRIAQMLIAPTPMIKWEEVEELDETSRGEGGYGSTDKS